MRHLEVFFDYGSPYAYLAWYRIHHNPERYLDTRISWRPCSLAHIVRRDGAKINAEQPNLIQYNFQDLQRWGQAYGAPLRIPTSFPCNSLLAARIHIHAQQQGEQREAAWMNAVWAAHFEADLDISDPAILQALTAQTGLQDAVTILADPALKQALIKNTDAAYSAGAPGVPYFVHNGDGFWGNDRLDWVEARLAGDASPIAATPQRSQG